MPYFGNQVITKKILTGSGRFVTKHYRVGNGIMKEIRIGKDVIGRRRYIHVGKRNPVLSAPVRKSVSSREVMDKIGNSLSGMGLGSSRRSFRGRGIANIN